METESVGGTRTLGGGGGLGGGWGGGGGGGLERERGEFSRLGKLPEVNILFEFVVVVVEFLELVLELSLVVAARML